MKRFAILSTALCVMLSGCTTEQPLNDDTTPNIESGTPPEFAEDKPQAQAFVFKSGVLEVGDFDPYTIGDDIFDPCTEITQEEFAAAGFEDVEPLPEQYAALAHGMKSCTGPSDNHIRSPFFLQNNADRDHISANTGLLEYQSPLIPALYTYGPRTGDGIDCFAQVDTLRGGLVIGVAGIKGFGSQEKNCQTAITSLEALFDANQ
ncbi:hypothetical protein [Corynebacterium sp. HMSC036E10]|uniref:hypothetical protein n=1 Tax=Corynebacterium sp. HMSC036E10 TaxID=1715215 RepID=UPI00114D38B5|nr:hypothetical protein [Corynebacterium sp. HMSC036E10]